jgi:hypothetical protein
VPSIVLPRDVTVKGAPVARRLLRHRRPVGLWIIEATDLDVALRLAAGGSKADSRKVDVRPFE